MKPLRIGPREADLLMDGLLALASLWEGAEEGSVYAGTAEDERRKARLMRKLRPLRDSPQTMHERPSGATTRPGKGV